ncbi:MAG TPA: hypothetical protein VG960_03955, partial [Caulobacteraceae bacterium]|nr:hypothetical protein [Caulobacteraceae bacterium]
MQDKIEIFRPGTHRAENGQSYTFTEADVAAIAGAYDPAVFASPLVLGHPKTDDPAWGWVAGLSINAAGVLVATHEKVAAEFAEGVDAGRYRKVSAAFYAPEDPANPTPGAWYLRHVGYLGAQAPAVKGLQAAFAADAAEGVAFADAAFPTSWGLSTAAQAVRSIRDWILAK